jgi:hypothetical protein
MRVHLPIEIKPGELRCPRCFLRDIVPSMRRGFVDGILFSLGREPRHCRSCGCRFYIRRKKEKQVEPEGPPAD